MAHYEAPLLHSSQDMMQELFEEINDYLGDKDKPRLACPASPVPSPFNVSTESEEEEHSAEHTQTDNKSMMDQNEAAYQTQAPLQPAMFVESDDEDLSADHCDTRDLAHIDHDQNELAVCMCYKCKNDQTGHPEPQQVHENTNYDKSISALCQLSPFKRRSKPNPSFGGAVGNAKLAHIAGLVKQTLTSTPRDILPTTTTHKRPANDRRHSALSSNSTLDKLDSSLTPLPTSSSTTSNYGYGSNIEQGTHFPSMASSFKDTLHSEIGTSSSRHDNISDHSFNGCIDYQGKNGAWMMAGTEDLDDHVGSMAWNTSTNQEEENQNETGIYSEQGMGNTDPIALMAAADGLDSYPGEKQQLIDDFPLAQQLPFLTPTHRIGEPHSIALRTRLARDVGSHEDRINAYNNAYSHCIMARTDMVPWIKKQYSKGPPNLVLQYEPKPRKSSKSLFGLFKRHSKSDDTSPSASLTANYNANMSKLSVSSARSSILTESLNAVSPQSSFTPLESYFPQQQSQQQNNMQQTNDTTSILSPTSPSNDEDMYLAPSDSSGQKSYKNMAKPKLYEQHRRSPSPLRTTAGWKKNSKSLSSPVEPVSILKKSSSMASMTDRSEGPVLKKSPSSASFVDEEFTPSYQSNSPGSSFGFIDDPYASNLKKNRSPSPNPPMKSRELVPCRRSSSPLSYAPVPTKNSNNSKRDQLLCPPDNRLPARQRSRSVSPSPRQPPTHRSRSLSPIGPPIRRSSFVDEYSEGHHHYRQHPPSDYRRSASPSAGPPNRQYTIPADRHLSPRRYANDDNKRHHRSNTHTSSPANNERTGRKVHRTRSTEHYDHYAPPPPPPPIDTLNSDSGIVKMDRRPRRSSYRLSSPLPYDESSYLLPLEQQHLPPRVSSHRRLRSASPNHQPPLLVPTSRRVTDPPNISSRHRDRPMHHRRRSMVMEEQDISGNYYCEDEGYFSQKSPRSSNHSKRRPSSSTAHQLPPPLSKQQQQHHNDALHDLCAFFQHLPRHVLANYLQDAGGDFFLAKDLCMEDIMANGI